jgi:hypothetical protein
MDVRNQALVSVSQLEKHAPFETLVGIPRQPHKSGKERPHTSLL